jgi:hypothetical protein
MLFATLIALQLKVRKMVRRSHQIIDYQLK